MNQGPLKEPNNVDLVVSGGELTAADRKLLAEFIRQNSKAAYRERKAIARLKAAMQEVPDWSEAIAVHAVRGNWPYEHMRPVAISTGSDIIDMDESGIGGSPTEEEFKEISAFIRELKPHKAAVKAIKQAEKRRAVQRTARRTNKRYTDVEHTSTLAKEPEAPRWGKAKVKRKGKSKNA